MPLSAAPDDGVEGFPHPVFEQQGRRGLAHLSLDLLGGVLLLRAVLAELRQLVHRVGRRLFTERRLEQAVGDEIGIAAVRRRGVGVVLDRQAEVSRRIAARRISHVLARPQQLDHRE